MIEGSNDRTVERASKRLLKLPRGLDPPIGTFAPPDRHLQAPRATRASTVRRRDDVADGTRSRRQIMRPCITALRFPVLLRPPPLPYYANRATGRFQMDQQPRQTFNGENFQYPLIEKRLQATAFERPTTGAIHAWKDVFFHTGRSWVRERVSGSSTCWNITVHSEIQTIFSIPRFELLIGDDDGAHQFGLPPPVPQESISNFSDAPASEVTCLKTASALGLGWDGMKESKRVPPRYFRGGFRGSAIDWHVGGLVSK